MTSSLLFLKCCNVTKSVFYYQANCNFTLFSLAENIWLNRLIFIKWIAFDEVVFVRLYAIYFVGCARIVPSLRLSAESPFRLKVGMSAHVASASVGALNLNLIFKWKSRVFSLRLRLCSFVHSAPRHTRHRAGAGNLCIVPF